MDNVNQYVLRALFFDVYAKLAHITDKSLKLNQELTIVNAENIAFSTKFFNIE